MAAGIGEGVPAAPPARWPAPFRLEGCDVWPDRLEIVRAGQAHRIEPKSMRLLCLLVQADGRTVSREEMVQAVWDGQAITDDAITRQLAKLRDALDDDARRPRLIMTVPKVGVRLMVSATALGPTEVDPGSPAVVPSMGQSRRLTGVLVATALALLAGLGGGVAYVWRDTGPPWSRPALSQPVEVEEGMQLSPAISPNGVWLAYAQRGRGDQDGIYIRRVAGDDRVRITPAGVKGSSPAWAPDMSRLAYVRLDPGACQIMVAAFPSGEAQPVGRCSRVLEGGLTWVDDDRIVASESSDRGAAGLFLYELSSGERRQLTEQPAASAGDLFPAGASDGRTVYFVRRQSMERAQVMALDVETGAVRAVTTSPEPLYGLAVAGDRLILAGLAEDRGPAVLSLNPVTGRRRVLNEGALYGKISTSVEAGRIYLERFTARIRLAAVDMADLGNARQITSTTLGDWLPTASPSGDRIGFLSTRAGAPQVWFTDGEGNDPRQLTRFVGEWPQEMTWSADSRTLFVSVDTRDTTRIARVEVPGGRYRFITRPGFEDRYPVLDPSGGGLYFVRRTGDRSELYRLDLATGGEQHVLPDVVRVMDDGQGRLYLMRSGPSLWAYQPAQPPSQIARLPLHRSPNWSPTSLPGVNWLALPGRVLMVDEGNQLLSVDTETGRVSRVGLLPGFYYLSGLAAVGDRLIYSDSDGLEGDIYSLPLS